jgi:hypothetical protein
VPLRRSTTGVCHTLLWFPAHSDPTCSAELFHTQWPPLHLVVQVVHIEVTQMGHTDTTQPIAYLIGKKAIPYQTRGGTCCPGGFTPKIQSLADSSMTSHIT